MLIISLILLLMGLSMASVVGDGLPDPQPDDPDSDGDPPVGDDDPDTYVPEFDDDGYDQYNLDKDGNPRPDDDDPDGDPDPEPVTPKPAAVTPRAETPKPAAQPTAQRQIYTRDNMYSKEELERLADLDLNNPTAAHAMRTDKERSLANYAEDRFDEDMDEFERIAPTVVKEFGRQIAKFRRGLSHEQKQQPGISRQVSAMIVANELAADPATMEELIKSLKGGSAPAARTPAKPAAPAAPTRRVIPPDERVPAPRGATIRRTVPTAQTGGRNLEKVVAAVHPGMSDADRKQFLDGIAIQEAERRR